MTPLPSDTVPQIRHRDANTSKMKAQIFLCATLVCLGLAYPLANTLGSNDGQSTLLPDNEPAPSRQRRGIPILSAIIAGSRFFSILFRIISGSKTIGHMAGAMYGVQVSHIIAMQALKAVGTKTLGALSAAMRSSAFAKVGAALTEGAVVAGVTGIAGGAAKALITAGFDN
ncbi:uncharacterized protein HRG_01640 [Hirsutella rhossiliensis]|uniref:Uncharacterized protein n=1 Tax=Hirsutella rhossiliensis TaxID=111463 RepID=A0A9P8SMK6_9HYPO|nr:uncharacterized protein HRG_01640 [Hirsutella rhossiliensis]KAH0966231.1 hypothetical protein HRG_01640 [Hirsutella rhossiliensis]